MTAVNEAAIREVMAFIKTHPERFEMGTWLATGYACGTVGCIAGWTYVLNEPDLSMDHALSSDLIVDEQMIDAIEDRAREHLGLTEDQAWLIFYYTHKRGPRRECDMPAQRCLIEHTVTYDDLVQRIKEVTGIDCEKEPT